MEVDLKDASQVTKSIEGRIEAIGWEWTTTN